MICSVLVTYQYFTSSLPLVYQYFISIFYQYFLSVVYQ